MNLDSLLRGINQYMKNIFNTFGGKSKEYIRALKDVKENIPSEVLERTARQGLDYEGDAPSEPLQLSRGKEAKDVLQHFGSDLKQTREDQKQMGTALAQSQKYYEDAENRGEDPADIDIQEEAEKLYDFDNSTNDWYDAIMSDPDISDDNKEEIRDLYSDLFENYEDAAFRDKLESRCRDILKQAEALRADTAEEAAAVPDVGYNPSDDFGGKL